MTSELHLPWLGMAILLPLLGAFLAFLWRNHHRHVYRMSWVISGLTLLCTIGEWADFATLNTFGAHDHWDIFRMLAAQDVFVVDELSAPLLPLTALLYFLAILSTPQSKAARFPFLLALFSEAVGLALVSCNSTGLIISFLGLSMIPLWIELRDRNQSTRSFSLHMGLYVTLLLAGWMLIHFSEEGDSISFAATIVLLMASVLRAGIIPVHPWLADLFERASFGTALLFITPMSGAYAVMRLVLPVAPTWAMQSIAILSLITAVYAAGMALVQTEMRRFFCYLFLSQSSLVFAGLEISNTVGLTGALCTWLSVGLSLGGLGLIMRMVEARIGSVSLNCYHGLFGDMPLLASLFLLTGLSSIGFPGTLGFVGMELLVEGTVEFNPLVGAAVVLAAALNGIAILRAYFLIFTGTRHIATISLASRKPEKFAAILLSLIVLGGGLWPQPLVHSRYHAAVVLLRLRSKAEPSGAVIAAPGIASPHGQAAE
jgi:NADH-quinone oxidoreductase subunit M